MIKQQVTNTHLSLFIFSIVFHDLVNWRLTKIILELHEVDLEALMRHKEINRRNRRTSPTDFIMQQYKRSNK